MILIDEFHDGHHQRSQASISRMHVMFFLKQNTQKT